MYKNIMVPVDLAHVEKLDKALRTAADLASHYGASLLFVGISASAPSALAHTPAEYTARLEAFARAQGERFGIAATARAYISHDPARDLDATLMTAIEQNQADLVVMASHVPGAPEYLLASNAGYLASHGRISVFVVRD